MTITKLGPTENFAALNPPGWLQRDMVRLAYQHPNFRLLTLFAGDVQSGFELDEICHNHFGETNAFSERRQELTTALIGHGGYTCVNLTHVPHTISYSHLTGKPVAILQPIEKPDAAIIVLPPRALQPHKFVSLSLNIGYLLCSTHDDVNLHHGVLGHEWGHVLNWLRQPAKFVWRQDERQADAHLMVLPMRPPPVFLETGAA